VSDESARLAALDTRVGALEQITARLTQRAEDTREDVKAFAPLTYDVIQMKERVQSLISRTDAIERRHAEFEKQLAARDEADKQREVETRRWKLTTYIAVFVALTGFVGLVLTALAVLGSH